MRICMGRQRGVDIVDIRLTEGLRDEILSLSDLYSEERLSYCSCRHHACRMDRTQAMCQVRDGLNRNRCVNTALSAFIKQFN